MSHLCSRAALEERLPRRQVRPSGKAHGKKVASDPPESNRARCPGPKDAPRAGRRAQPHPSDAKGPLMTAAGFSARHRPSGGGTALVTLGPRPGGHCGTVTRRAGECGPPGPCDLAAGAGRLALGRRLSCSRLSRPADGSGQPAAAPEPAPPVICGEVRPRRSMKPRTGARGRNHVPTFAAHQGVCAAGIRMRG